MATSIYDSISEMWRRMEEDLIFLYRECRADHVPFAQAVRTFNEGSDPECQIPDGAFKAFEAQLISGDRCPACGYTESVNPGTQMCGDCQFEAVLDAYYSLENGDK